MQDETYCQMTFDAYLIHRCLIDLIPSMISSYTQITVETLYPKHTEDKGDHRIVYQCFTIVRIIDWEWAISLPDAKPHSLILQDVLSIIEGQFVMYSARKRQLSRWRISKTHTMTVAVEFTDHAYLYSALYLPTSTL